MHVLLAAAACLAGQTVRGMLCQKTARTRMSRALRPLTKPSSWTAGLFQMALLKQRLGDAAKTFQYKPRYVRICVFCWLPMHVQPSRICAAYFVNRLSARMSRALSLLTKLFIHRQPGSTCNNHDLNLHIASCLSGSTALFCIIRYITNPNELGESCSVRRQGLCQRSVRPDEPGAFACASRAALQASKRACRTHVQTQGARSARACARMSGAFVN